MRPRFNPRALAVVIILVAVGFAANPDSRVAAPAVPALELEATSTDPGTRATMTVDSSRLSDPATSADSAASHVRD